jgi:alcohol dehydrogenase class IV
MISTLDWSGLAPFIAIPTTAGTGSEVGRSSVITMDGRKRVLFHPALLAAFVILDPELTADLPARLTAATGADALTHCIESYTSTVFHPLCDGIALEGLHLIAHALPRAVKNGNDLEARGQMLIAAMMGGIAFQKDLGVVHSLSHPLSTMCGLHHGTANALTLPASMEFNAARRPGLYRRVGVALGLNDPDDRATIAFVRSFLEGIGLRRDCAITASSPRNSPRWRRRRWRIPATRPIPCLSPRKICGTCTKPLIDAMNFPPNSCSTANSKRPPTEKRCPSSTRPPRKPVRNRLRLDARCRNAAKARSRPTKRSGAT